MVNLTWEEIDKILSTKTEAETLEQFLSAMSLEDWRKCVNEETAQRLFNLWQNMEAK